MITYVVVLVKSIYYCTFKSMIFERVIVIKSVKVKKKFQKCQDDLNSHFPEDLKNDTFESVKIKSARVDRLHHNILF